MQVKKTKTPFAKKSFGQNFLTDRHYIAKIIDALDPQTNEPVVEIGPGRGALTEKLLDRGARVTAIELEREMIALLREKFAGRENFTLIAADALKIDFAELAARPAGPDRSSAEGPQRVKLVANLPYYISTAILQKLIGERRVFSEMILMFQREVVDRLTAAPGTKERGFLSVYVEAFLAAEKLFDVPPSAFRPAPKVRSAVVRLRPKNETNVADEPLFRELLAAGFAQKRKTILNNLKNAPPSLQTKIGDSGDFLKNSEIDSGRRAESLDLEEWTRMFGSLS